MVIAHLLKFNDWHFMYLHTLAYCCLAKNFWFIAMCKGDMNPGILHMIDDSATN